MYDASQGIFERTLLKGSTYSLLVLGVDVGVKLLNAATPVNQDHLDFSHSESLRT